MIKKLSIICFKSVEDNRNFRIFRGFGVEVQCIEDLEKTDKIIDEAIGKKYSTIILSNEVASFSQNLITKYNKFDNVNIIISHK